MHDIHTLISEQLTHNQWGLLGNQGCVMGIDLGSYGLRAGLIYLTNQTFSTIHTELRATNPDQIVVESIELGKQLLRQAEIAPGMLVRVGVGFGGPVDLRYGTVRLSPRLSGWENYPLQERFEQAFDAVTLINNDANLIALGESTFGIGKGCQHLFYLHLSSGVGGGMVLDGRLYHGATSTAGEIGHAVVGMAWGDGERPRTLEQLVSIKGLLDRARQLGLETSNLEDIFGKHPAAQQVLRETTSLLATRIAQIIALLDPQMIVLGGIVARIGGETFIGAIREQVNQYIAPEFTRPVEINASMLAPDSVTIGALAYALESLRD